MSSNHKHEAHENLLTSVAESVGSAFGTIAANARAVSNAVSKSSLPQAAKREGRKFVRKSKSLARQVQRTASKSLNGNKLGIAARKALRRTAATARRRRPVTSKKKITRRGSKK